MYLRSIDRLEAKDGHAVQSRTAKNSSLAQDADLLLMKNSRLRARFGIRRRHMPVLHMI